MPKTKELNLESLAEQFDELAQVCIAIGGTFRAAAGGGADSGDEPAPGKRGAAGSGKGLAKKAGGKAKPAAEDDALDLDTVRAKLKELAEAKGTEKMVEALEHVGAAKLGEVDEEQYQELFDKAEELLAEEDEPEEEDEPPAKPAKKTAAKKATKKKAGPTLEDVQAAADALEEADAKAFKRVARKVGDHDDLDEDAYQDAIDQYEAAMPE